GGTPSRTSKPASTTPPAEYLRSRVAHRDGRSSASGGVRRKPGALRRRLRTGTRRVRDPARHAHRPGARAKARRVLLLDIVGRLDEPPERHDHVYEQLAS